MDTTIPQFNGEMAMTTKAEKKVTWHYSHIVCTGPLEVGLALGNLLPNQLQNYAIPRTIY